MRAVVQRVTSASVTSRSEPTEPFAVVGAIDAGLMVLVGVTNLGAHDVGASLLVVSQFTLYGDTSKGRRPSWVAAARPEHAEPLVERVVERLRADGFTVETGRFRTEMQVSLVNDGPITLVVET